MSAYLSLIGRVGGGRLFEGGRLLTFSAFGMGAYSRWALIRGWALIRINMVTRATNATTFFFVKHLFEGANIAYPRNFYSI